MTSNLRGQYTALSGDDKFDHAFAEKLNRLSRMQSGDAYFKQLEDPFFERTQVPARKPVLMHSQPHRAHTLPQIIEPESSNVQEKLIDIEDTEEFPLRPEAHHLYAHAPTATLYFELQQTETMTSKRTDRFECFLDASQLLTMDAYTKAEKNTHLRHQVRGKLRRAATTVGGKAERVEERLRPGKLSYAGRCARRVSNLTKRKH